MGCSVEQIPGNVEGDGKLVAWYGGGLICHNSSVKEGEEKSEQRHMYDSLYKIHQRNPAGYFLANNTERR